jgi:hypothetical protein
LKPKLAKELLSREELVVAAHKQGFGGLDEVESATLDPSGAICFVGKKPAPEESRHGELLAKIDQLAQEVAGLRSRLVPPVQ